MPVRPLSMSPRSRQCVMIAGALFMTWFSDAAAFPTLDNAGSDPVPQGAEMEAPDAQDLAHQLQLSEGAAAPQGGGWTFLPRLTVQEEFTDNVLQQNTPRRADFGTFVAPGFQLIGDTPRLKASIDFAPMLEVYGQTSSLNSLTEQLNGIATLTVAPDLAYVDIRALSGLQNQFGGLGGIGTLGAPATGDGGMGTIPSFTANSIGLTPNNEVQTSSFGISPYLLHQFGDWGTGRLGYSIDATHTSTLSGFAASPFQTGGSNGQSLISQEESGHFETGEIMQSLRDSIDIDLTQGQTTTDRDFDTSGRALPGDANDTSSSRIMASNRLTYQLNREIAVFVEGGHEDLAYSGLGFTGIHDFTWRLGTTLTPNPDSAITVGYGHLYGTNSLSVDARYALTARTTLTATYGSSFGTQLETVQNQLNLAKPGPNGGLVNALTGTPLFAGSNALPVANGLYRTTTLVIGGQTVLERDTFRVNAVAAKQSTVGVGNSGTDTSKLIGASWVHQMRPNMFISAGASVSWDDQSDGFGFGPGRSVSIASTVAWRYQIFQDVTLNVSYSFLDRHSSASAFSMTQNLLLFGITKTF
jgi:uncharacterized protein (PEP-CTERM system associated)